MDITGGEYKKMAQKASPPTNKPKNGIMFGGGICAAGESLKTAFERAGLKEDDIKLLVPVILIVAAAVLTAVGVFDRIARIAGAGTIVPITGFANSIVSPAMEFQSEGRILGTGAQMFRISESVLAYGSAAAMIYGVIYYLTFK